MSKGNKIGQPTQKLISGPNLEMQYRNKRCDTSQGEQRKASGQTVNKNLNFEIVQYVQIW